MERVVLSDTESYGQTLRKALFISLLRKRGVFSVKIQLQGR